MDLGTIRHTNPQTADLVISRAILQIHQAQRYNDVTLFLGQMCEMKHM